MKQEGMTPEVAKKFKYWQTRTIIASMIGYALFYFVRKNLSIAMPAMQEDLGITKGDLGLFLTLHGLLYGVSKFANGFIGDRVNARYFMVTGLVLSAVCNILFGFSSAVLVFGIVWMLNGWFQGMGFPPCARLLTHWIPPTQLATKMSIWNTSHSVGAGLVVIVCGYIVSLGWRWCFWFPSIIALVGAVGLWFALRDTPRSVGLPELNQKGAGEAKEESPKEFKAFVRKHVFGNPTIWVLAFANFFVYIVRYAVLDWGPTLLGEWKGISIQHAGWMVAAFEISGICGDVDGRLGDRPLLWRTRTTSLRALYGFGYGVYSFILGITRTFDVVGYMFARSCRILHLWSSGTRWYCCSQYSYKKAAATAVGFTGLFGYASTLVSGWGLGLLAQHYGWDVAVGALILIAVVGTFIFMAAWTAKANGYDEGN